VPFVLCVEIGKYKMSVFEFDDTSARELSESGWLEMTTVSIFLSL